METTLTLHDIAPFLPFQLTGKAWIYYLKETAQWVDCTVVGATPKDLLLQCYDHGGNKWPGVTQLDYKYFKPNLRPIFNIVTHNPKTLKPYFVDIFSTVVATPFLGQNNKFWTWQINTDRPDFQFIEIKNKYNEFSFTLYDNGDLLAYRLGDSEPGDGFAKYFRALYMYHFDVDGLIKKGLANELQL